MLEILRKLFAKRPPPKVDVKVATGAQGPTVAVLLSRVEERIAYQKALEREGLSVLAPEPPGLPNWPGLSELGHPKLLVVDDLSYYAELKSAPVDVILITDGEFEPGPHEDRSFIVHRPVDLGNPLGK